MAGSKVTIILLWMIFCYCTAKETVRKRDLDKNYLHKPQISTREEPGFFSRIANWIFSYPSPTDSVPSSSYHSETKYLPPTNFHSTPKHIPSPQQNGFSLSKYLPFTSSPQHSDCNPCNKEPWIPVLGKSSVKTETYSSSHQNEVDLNPPPPPYQPQEAKENHVQIHNEYYPPPPIPSLNNQYSLHTSSSKNTKSINSFFTQPNNIGSPHGSTLPYINSHNQYIPPPIHLPKRHPTNINLHPTPSYNSHQFINKNEPKDYMLPPPIQKTNHNNIYQNIIGMKVPPFPSTLPVQQQSPNNIRDVILFPVSQYSILDEDFPPITKNPIGQYPANNVQGIEQIPLSSGDSEYSSHAIAFPNLSIRPLTPIHNYVNFRKGQHQKVESVQILPSIPIADFVSSIEHPVNVIQSPIFDLSIRNDTEEKFLNINNNQPIQPQPQLHPIYTNLRQDSTQSGLFINPSVHKVKLTENPIVVDDAVAAASIHNETIHIENDLSIENNERNENISQVLSLNARENDHTASSINDEQIYQSSSTKEENINQSILSTEIPIDYSPWSPSSGVSTKELSTPVNWPTPVSKDIYPKKTKHVQIIVPYYNFNTSFQTPKNEWKNNIKHKFNYSFKENMKSDKYTTLLPIYTPPSSTEKSLWSEFLSDLYVSPSGSASASAFKLLGSNNGHNENKYVTQELPFDILSFQKNIDDWTQQAFAKTTEKLSSSQGVLLNPSKNIPNEYLNTVPYDYTTIKPMKISYSDHEAAGSVRNNKYEDAFGNNLILEDTSTTTEEGTTLTDTTDMSTTEHSMNKTSKSLWDSINISISPTTKEKVYVVTPANLQVTTVSPISWSLPPRIDNTKEDKTLVYEHPKFSIRIGENNTQSMENANYTTKIIYSEWPHKINNLEVTTKKLTTRHPLFGFMDVSVSAEQKEDTHN